MGMIFNTLFSFGRKKKEGRWPPAGSVAGNAVPLPSPAGISPGADHPCDLSLFREAGSNEYLLDILNILLTNLPLQLKELETAARGEDFRNMEFLTHKLRGTTAMLQAPELLGLVKEMKERISRQADIRDLVEQAWKSYTPIEGFLETEKQKVQALIL